MATVMANAKRSKPKSEGSDFTQKMSLHLNGGSEFSVLAHDIFFRGRATNIIRTVKTNGSPDYKKTDDVFSCGGDEFDVMKNGKVGLLDWLKAHVRKKSSRESVG